MPVEMYCHTVFSVEGVAPAERFTKLIAKPSPDEVSGRHS